jgi:hypothetical protein
MLTFEDLKPDPGPSLISDNFMEIAKFLDLDSLIAFSKLSKTLNQTAQALIYNSMLTFHFDWFLFFKDPTADTKTDTMEKPRKNSISPETRFVQRNKFLLDKNDLFIKLPDQTKADVIKKIPPKLQKIHRKLARFHSTLSDFSIRERFVLGLAIGLLSQTIIGLSIAVGLIFLPNFIATLGIVSYILVTLGPSFLFPCLAYWMACVGAYFSTKNEIANLNKELCSLENQLLDIQKVGPLNTIWVPADSEVFAAITPNNCMKEAASPNTVIIRVKDNKLEFFFRQSHDTKLKRIELGETLKNYCQTAGINFETFYENLVAQESLLEMINNDPGIKNQVLGLQGLNQIMELFDLIKNTQSPTILKIQGAIKKEATKKEPSIKILDDICQIIRDRSTFFSFFAQNDSDDMKDLFKLVDKAGFNLKKIEHQDTFIKQLQKIVPSDDKQSQDHTPVA